MRKLIVAIAVAALLGALALLGASIATGRDLSAAGTKAVTVSDNVYRPHKFSISRNSIVKWTWASDVASDHTVTQADRRFNPKDHGFGSKDQTSGTYSHRFKRAGTYYIVCLVHPTDMRMKIVVR